MLLAKAKLLFTSDCTNEQLLQFKMNSRSTYFQIVLCMYSLSHDKLPYSCGKDNSNPTSLGCFNLKSFQTTA